MVGGYALLKDVFKTDVFRLARHLNERAGRELIPVSTIERPPSAELRAEQRDDQSLPPYEVLDPVLEAYIELDRSRDELVEQFDPEIVDADARARRPRRVQAPAGGAGGQAPPRAFGRDWRTPITNHWQGLAAVRSASAVTVRQFRTVTVVGSRRFVRASMSFDRAWPFGTLIRSCAPTWVQVVGRVVAEVAEPEAPRSRRLPEERDDDASSGRPRSTGFASTTFASSLPVRTTTGDVVTGRASRSLCSSAAARSPRLPFAGVKTTFPLWR